MSADSIFVGVFIYSGFFLAAEEDDDTIDLSFGGAAKGFIVSNTCYGYWLTVFFIYN